jgi:serine/threonine protein kinase
VTPERWQQVEEIFQAALDREPAERAAFLDGACAGDDELKIQAGSLVSAHDAAGDFIEHPAIAQDAQLLLDEHTQSNIGRDVGPYKIVKHIGQGGMGEVYLARDTRLDRQVALKILPAYFVADDARLRRFQREARAASALNHPNIITIFEIGEQDQVHYIATEFVDGRTLTELSRSEDFPITKVLDIAMQVASALAAAHADGIVHRDIKPENIMLRQDGLVKLLDFGIAKLVERDQSDPASLSTHTATQTEVGMVVGTAAYMSPEQARALAVDERTDIWSLGVVLYEMLTGELPFAGATRMDTMVAVLERAPARLFFAGDSPRFMFDFQRIVDKALQKDKTKRYPSAVEMLTDLRRANLQVESAHASGNQITVASLRRSSESKYLVSQTKTHRRGYRWAAAAMALMILITAGVFLYRRAFHPITSNSTTNKIYTQMSDVEQLAFVQAQEQRIAAMMGERPVELNDDALRAIKRPLDRYVARADSASNQLGGESLPVVYSRAAQYVPLIARSFSAHKIPIVIGVYVPMIESEYRPCSENTLGAKGLFQFMPRTAEAYGVARSEMCDAEKMTPAAAQYIADRMAELGDDSQSMTLVLLSFNQGPDQVRDALRRLRDTPNYQRNFWTLLANREQLGSDFGQESAGYVPAFFAAAIIGENPQAFGLQTPPLSSLASR